MTKLYKTSEDQREKARERARRNRRAAGIPERKFADVEERLWGRAIAGEGGCILWDGHLNHHGYGHIGVGKKLKRTHRLAWELTNGPIPDGKRVLHKCDVPRCINPSHLFLGSQSDNMRDMHGKSRAAIGERHGNAKITEDQVMSILSDARGPSKVAAQYGISASTVCDIRAGRSWKHVRKEKEIAGISLSGTGATCRPSGWRRWPR